MPQLKKLKQKQNNSFKLESRKFLARNVYVGFSWSYLSNGRAYGTVVVCRLSVLHGCIVAKH